MDLALGTGSPLRSHVGHTVARDETASGRVLLRQRLERRHLRLGMRPRDSGSFLRLCASSSGLLGVCGFGVCGPSGLEYHRRHSRNDMRTQVSFHSACRQQFPVLPPGHLIAFTNLKWFWQRSFPACQCVKLGLLYSDR